MNCLTIAGGISTKAAAITNSEAVLMLMAVAAGLGQHRIERKRLQQSPKRLYLVEVALPVGREVVEVEARLRVGDGHGHGAALERQWRIRSRPGLAQMIGGVVFGVARQQHA